MSMFRYQNLAIKQKGSLSCLLNICETLQIETSQINITCRISCGIYQRDQQCQESFAYRYRTGVILMTPRF